MNVNMFENVAVQENLEILRRRGMIVMEPAMGNLACGYAGKGRMPEPEVLLEEITRILGMPKVFAGKHILVTAGATREPIDAVRYISNPSTGKMGYACARAALMAGARVTLVTGPTSLPPVLGAQMVHVTTASEMAQAVFDVAKDADIIIMSAAVSDFTPEFQEKHKIHKTDASLCIELKPTVDILQTLGLQKRPNQYLCGFCMETENLVERAKYKLVSKHLDLVVANSLNEPGCGFAGDTNGVTLISQGEEKRLNVADKLEIAIQIMEYIHHSLAK
jgi:phosphopantothenoylcysteine decarboxylase/phosphopantothenate--cysteine ligase